MSFEQIYEQGLHIYLLAPFLVTLLLCILYKSTEANHFLLNFGRVLYTTVIAFCLYKLFGGLKIPPNTFFDGLILSTLSLALLFFFSKKPRYIIQFVLLNFLLVLIFNKQYQSSLIFIVTLASIINILFLLLYGIATGRKPIYFKWVHALTLISIAVWAFNLNQPLIFYAAVVCSSSIVTVALLKVIFMGGLVPNFSRQLVDIGVPLILLWLLINISGVFFQLLSPFISVDVFYN